MFDKLSKGSGDYLKQIKNNIPEKTGLIEQAIHNKNLPKAKDGKIKIIELGIGGGESLKQLRKITESNSEIELLAVDIIPDLAASLKKETGIQGVAADAGLFPFADNSISAINASAILHEVSSYGTGIYVEGNASKEILYNREAVIKTLGEFNRVLLPGGQLAYRDLLAPVEDLETPKTVKYFNRSWQLFIKWFAKDFLTSNSHFTENTPVTVNDSGSVCTINASVKFHRELQRHYLMFRDYLRTVKQKDVGLDIVRSDWLDENKGLKIFTFSLEHRLVSRVNVAGFEIHDSAQGEIYRGDSDQFDKMYDEIIEYYFTQLNTDSKESKHLRKIIEAWKAREGSEHYIYGNIVDMLSFSCEATKNTNSPYVLFPESSIDIATPQRFYYNRYLKQVIDMPEKDGKQIIAFKKMPKAKARQCLKTLYASSTGKEILDEEAVAKMNAILE